MGHTYSQVLLHIVFSTKDRKPFIDDSIASRLHEYMGGIVNRDIGSTILFGGVEDHIPGLINVKPAISIADAMRQLKAVSSGWVHKTFPDKQAFAWQVGYAAFSLSRSNVDAVCRYIRNQKEHHRKMTFQEELIELLERHGVQYDSRYVFD